MNMGCIVGTQSVRFKKKPTRDQAHAKSMTKAPTLASVRHLFQVEGKALTRETWRQFLQRACQTAGQ